MVYEIYTQQGLSINAIARLLNEREIPTRTGKSRWERSTVWGILRNRPTVERPAMGRRSCAHGKESRGRCGSEKAYRVVTALTASDHARSGFQYQYLVSEEIFALAQEQLEKNKKHSLRRTIEPTLLQGMLVCEQCGYTLYRCSSRTSKHKLHYYRCLGSDGYGDCADRRARIVRSGKTIWTNLYGMRSSGCWKIRAWSRARSIAAAQLRKTPICFASDKKSYAESRRG
jgi:site-specific DNA recombinase